MWGYVSWWFLFSFPFRLVVNIFSYIIWNKPCIYLYKNMYSVAYIVRLYMYIGVYIYIYIWNAIRLLKKEILPLVITCTNLNGIMLSEISQRMTNICFHRNTRLLVIMGWKKGNMGSYKSKGQICSFKRISSKDLKYHMWL